MNMTLLHSLFFMSSRNADTKNGCVADYYEYGHVCIINQWKGWDEILQSPANWKIIDNTAY